MSVRCSRKTPRVSQGLLWLHLTPTQRYALDQVDLSFLPSDHERAARIQIERSRPWWKADDYDRGRALLWLLQARREERSVNYIVRGIGLILLGFRTVVHMKDHYWVICLPLTLEGWRDRSLLDRWFHGQRHLADEDKAWNPMHFVAVVRPSVDRGRTWVDCYSTRSLVQSQCNQASIDRLLTLPAPYPLRENICRVHSDCRESTMLARECWETSTRKLEDRLSCISGKHIALSETQ